MNLAQEQSVLDELLKALNGMLQAQTDTLALIVVVVFLVVVGVIAVVTYLLFRGRGKIAIPATEPGQPAQIVTEKEFLGVLVNTFFERLKTLNEQNAQLENRLKESIGYNDKLAPILAGMSSQLAIVASAKDVTSTTQAVIGLTQHVDTKLQEMQQSRQEIGKNMNEMLSDGKDIQGKVNRILEMLGVLESRITELKTEIDSLVSKEKIESVKTTEPVKPADLPTPAASSDVPAPQPPKTEPEKPSTGPEKPSSIGE